jgi:hypothetical protein
LAVRKTRGPTVREIPDHSGLISQLEAAKFTRLVRYMIALPVKDGAPQMPVTGHGIDQTEIFVRMLGKQGPPGKWPAAWVFQPAYLPVGLWSEKTIVSNLKRNLTQARQDLETHPISNSLLDDPAPLPAMAHRYPVARESFYYLATNVASPLSDESQDELGAHFRTKFGDRATQFGLATPQSMAQHAPAATDRYILDLLNMPSSYYFVARQGRITVVPETEHGWYLVGRGDHAVPATATSALNIDVRGLSDLEALVNSRKTSEQDLQEFLTQNRHFLFALDERYCEIRPHVGLVSPVSTSLVPDFVARLEDSSRWDMIELKKPSAPIKVKRGRVESAGKEAASAIKQLMEYTDAVSTRKARAALTKAYGASPFEPCLMVVIGRGAPSRQYRWRSNRVGLPNVQLVTYDFLLERAREAKARNEQLLKQASIDDQISLLRKSIG